MLDFSISIPSFSELKSYHQHWTWQEIQWGKTIGLICSQDVITYAMELLEDGREDFSTLLELAIETADNYSVDQKIAALCYFEEKESTEQILLIWRKAILSWLYYNVECTNELQESIDALYADFNYPKDMLPLIGYMPSRTGHSSTPWDIRQFLKKYIEQ